ncbi:sialidase family protein [Maribellus maritimus]|uniref:sialidase family protein n=1 Tax=Maribellus maritimus TaxID=2870838 RepID=UPI001EEAE73F|nr:sialidase family protein [Maribellus maritimus]MCG6189539.1 glycoside hydrolase [Maribellus maritimus]
MKIHFINQSGILKILIAYFFISFAYSCKSENNDKTSKNKVQHIKVFYEIGKYGGWPANWGIWNWGEEILVGFTEADHEDKTGGHTFNQKTAMAKFARSLDGGLSWKVEDAYEHGITEATVEHNIGDKSKPATALTESIDFTHPDFALTFRMVDMLRGPSSFYYSYDRGKSWNGAYNLEVHFPGNNPAGIVTRTDYIVDGKHELTAFLTVGFYESTENWRQIACVRTTDGGLTWNFLSWIGPEKINSIMPSSIRLDSSRLLSVIRRTNPPRMVSYLSEDNGYSWKQLDDPVIVDSNGNPPALLKLKDGQLCLVYGIRRSETMPEGIGMYVTFSSDNGLTWDSPSLLRGNDGAIWDIGYPRSVELPDGKIVAVYYYNNADLGNKYRYIATSIFDPVQK